jgi:hypothetical protein
VTLLLETREKSDDRFTFLEKPKKEEREKKETKATPAAQGSREKLSVTKSVERPGFFQKVFRRKSI